MRRFLIFALSAFLLLPGQSAASVTEYNFKAWIDDRVVGTHDFTVTQNGDTTKVEAVARFVVKLLFVKVFDYQHTITEQWQGDCLVAIDSSTRTNGKKASLTDAALEGKSCPSTFAYWDRDKITKPQLMNGQTGEVLPSNLEKVETSLVPKTDIVAESFLLETSMGPIQLWYGATGEWIALQSEVNDRILTYVSTDLLSTAKL